MYLPVLGVDLREHIKGMRSVKKKISPTTQAVILFVLYNWPRDGVNPSRLAPLVNYTSMWPELLMKLRLQVSGVSRWNRVNKYCILRWIESLYGKNHSAYCALRCEIELISLCLTRRYRCCLPESRYCHATVCWHRRLVQLMLCPLENRRYCNWTTK